MILTTHLIGLCRVTRPSFNVLVSKRFFHQSQPHLKFINNFIRPASEESLKHSDKISPAFQLIYKAPMQNYILGVSCACCFTVAGLCFVTYCLYSGHISMEDLEKTYGHKTLVTTSKFDLSMSVIGLIGFNIMMFLTIRRLPLRIWRNGDNYQAVFEGHIPMVRRKFGFVKGDVEPMEIKGILPWRDSRFKIKGHRAILIEQYFKTPSELNMMINKKYRYY